jgi:hypothetical protein
MNIWNIHLKHTCIAITTCAISRSTFTTLIYNTCNIPLKYLKHTIATYAFSVASVCCLDEWRLVDAELDAVQSSMQWSGTEVASVELVDGMNLGRDRGSGRRMERDNDERSESGREHAAWADGGGSVAKDEVHPGAEAQRADRERTMLVGRHRRGTKGAGDLYGSVRMDGQPISSITVYL